MLNLVDIVAILFICRDRISLLRGSRISVSDVCLYGLGCLHVIDAEKL